MSDVPDHLMHCPFCHNPDIRTETDGRVFWMDCGDCDAQGPSAETEEDARDLWGYRHERKVGTRQTRAKKPSAPK